jgi:multicomponent K+:H+ antiporter subunit F
MEEKSGFGKVLRINLLLVLASAVVARLLCQFSADYALTAFAIIYLAQVLINVIIGFTKRGKSPAGYFLSALLVLLIGFSSCTGLLLFWEINGGPPR